MKKMILSAALLLLAALTGAFPKAGDRVWAFQTGESVFCTPFAAGGRVFTGSKDGRFYCLDGTNGAVVWSFETGGEIYSHPAVMNGNVYFGGCDNSVYCLDAASGAKVWAFETGYWIQSSPFVCNGRVFVGSCDSNFYCLDAADGAKVWSFAAGEEIWGGVAVADGIVFFGCNDDKLYCLDAASGRQVWYYMTDGDIYSTALVTNGLVYFGSYDGSVYCVDEATGRREWVFETGNSVFSSPVFADGRIYITSWDKRVYCLNAASGKRLWFYETGEQVFSTPCVARGRVYFGSDDNNFYCLDARSGRKLWNFRTEDNISSSAVIDNGLAYFGGYDGNVYCVDTGAPGLSARSLSCLQPDRDAWVYGRPNIRLAVRVHYPDNGLTMQAFQKGSVEVVLFNTGWGDAFNVLPDIKELATGSGLNINPAGPMDIGSGQAVSVIVDMDGNEDLKDGAGLFEVRAGGVSRTFRVVTRGFQKPMFTAQDGGMNDGGTNGGGDALGNGNRVPEEGEIVEYFIYICNKGVGDALGVTVIPEVVGEKMTYCGDSYEIAVGDLKAGESKKIVIPVVFGKKISAKDGTLKLTIRDRRNICERSESFRIRVK